MSNIYIDYLKSLKVGDTVYPCYDGKGRRATACRVVDTKKKYKKGRLRRYHLVEGIFWGNETVTQAWFINGEGYVSSNDGDPTLMQMMGVCSQGDYYSLLDIPYYKEWFRPEYLKQLGINEDI